MPRISLALLGRLLAVLLGLLAPTVAAQQGFNIDIGSNVAFPLPSSSYGGAAGQLGVWNAVSASTAGSTPLVALSGASTGVTISHTGGLGNFEFNNTGTSGNDQALMDDVGDVGGVGPTSTWLIQGLAVGTYQVYVYSWAPDDPVNYTTKITVIGGGPCQQISGGGIWPGSHVQGVTYVVDTVTVGAGALQIDLTTNAGFGSINGIQVVPTTPLLGNVIRGPIDLEAATGNANCGAADFAFGYFWVAADLDTVNSEPIAIYQLNSSFNLVATWPTSPYDGVGDLTHTKYQELVAGSTNTCAGPVGGSQTNYLYTAAPTPGTLAFMVCVDLSGKQPITFDGGVFWGTDSFGNIIKYKYDANGNIQIIEVFPVPLTATALAWDPTNANLWVFSLDSPCPAATTHLALFSEFDPVSGTLTGTKFRAATLATPDLAASAEIYEDPLNPGMLSIVAVQETAAGARLMAYGLGVLAPTCDSDTTYYCTPKVNSLGCTTMIAGAGVAKASWTSGYIVTGSQVRNNKPGLLFYGVSGQNAVPFQGGFLCVKAPVKRTPAVSSGGNPIPANDCSGLYKIDMNAFAQGLLGGTPLPALTVPGTVVDCQWWGRDPGFPAPSNTTLTDGLEYTVCP